MEKAKDGVTLIADAIRAEIAQAEKAKQTATPPANVIDVTAQFQNTPPANVSNKTDTSNTGNVTPATPPANVSNNSDTSNTGNDDGTIFKNE